MELPSKKKVVIAGKEYDLPDGIEQLSDDGLFAVDWSLIQIAKGNTTEEFKFFNPRHLGQCEIDRDNKKEVFLGQGFDKDSMKELMGDIAKHGQQYPFLGYWVTDDKDNVNVRVNDGERRWRCIDRLIEKNEKVWSAKDNAFLPAKEVYAKVLCRVASMSEEEAFARACAVSETAVKWGDGAQARLVKTLYEKGKKDDEICALLNKSKQWLAETSSLNDLDEYCFGFLLEAKINRKVALDLVKIKDVKIRQSWLKDAWKDAVQSNERMKAKADKLLEQAETEEDVALAEVAEARESGASPETVAELQQAATEAAEKTKKRKEVKAASAKPIVKSKGLRKASGGQLSSGLRPPKIRKKLVAIQEMIEKKDTSLVDLITLQILDVAYQAILDGEEDINMVLKKIATRLKG
jgi:hypothetical protein